MLVTTVVVLSLWPRLRAPGGVAGLDLIGHVVMYCTMMSWFGGAPERGRYVRVAGGLLALGAALEMAQLAVPGRGAELSDLAANACGIGVGLGASLRGLGGWWMRAEGALR